MWSEYVWADQRAVELREQAEEFRRARAARSVGRVRSRRRPPQPTEVICLRAAATGRCG